MKIQVASDLHLEFLDRMHPSFIGLAPAEDAEVLVLAGDIHNGCRGMELFATWPVPVVYVPGNHEYYGREFRAQRDTFCHADEDNYPSVIALERGIFEYKRVRFLGATLWTDFNLYGQPISSRRLSATRIFDYRTIRLAHSPFQTRDSLREHIKSVSWLDSVLAEPFPGLTVVVTHHAPHHLSLEADLVGHPLNPAFASNLQWMLGRCALWIHGHVHGSCDYALEGTRIIANPRGYPDMLGEISSADMVQWENRQFDPGLVVEIEHSVSLHQYSIDGDRRTYVSVPNV
ncbi:metallophosphoesterase [Cupriavidus sp. WGlv3]|uniref:metallophosphoesterase n=1 Tax=Cupriavidus sp. WGlv3 TaxID=2919924 RepID=UPI0020906675|nr:metallophosphoesterase [Cupriavidus sp. WGlv3]MCO4861237.1 metallophosphoesterase [Cupriavidus sp. WGlv3]